MLPPGCCYSLYFYRQEKEAADIHKIAESAVNLSTQAYDVAKDAINRQQNIR